MFQIENVSKTYNGKAKSKKGNADIVKAVDSLSLTVNNGEIFGFLGPNGAGKTTSIRMITGILQADEGDIKLDGISIKERPIAAKRTFAFVPDNPETFSRLKAIEYLNFICDVYKIPAEDRAKKISELCEKLLTIYANDNAIVYDPFMGTGTTGIACYNMGLDCFGSELSEAQVEYSKERLLKLQMEKQK